jgi:hypothetical protein
MTEEYTGYDPTTDTSTGHKHSADVPSMRHAQPVVPHEPRAIDTNAKAHESGGPTLNENVSARSLEIQQRHQELVERQRQLESSSRLTDDEVEKIVEQLDKQGKTDIVLDGVQERISAQTDYYRNLRSLGIDPATQIGNVDEIKGVPVSWRKSIDGEGFFNINKREIEMSGTPPTASDALSVLGQIGFIPRSQDFANHEYIHSIQAGGDEALKEAMAHRATIRGQALEKLPQADRVADTLAEAISGEYPHLDPNQVSAAVSTIDRLNALGFSLPEIAQAIAKNGGWDPENQSYAALDSLISATTKAMGLSPSDLSVLVDNDLLEKNISRLQTQEIVQGTLIDLVDKGEVDNVGIAQPKIQQVSPPQSPEVTAQPPQQEPGEVFRKPYDEFKKELGTTDASGKVTFRPDVLSDFRRFVKTEPDAQRLIEEDKARNQTAGEPLLRDIQAAERVLANLPPKLYEAFIDQHAKAAQADIEAARAKVEADKALIVDRFRQASQKGIIKADPDGIAKEVSGAIEGIKIIDRWNMPGGRQGQFNPETGDVQLTAGRLTDTERQDAVTHEIIHQVLTNPNTNGLMQTARPFGEAWTEVLTRSISEGTPLTDVAVLTRIMSELDEYKIEGAGLRAMLNSIDGNDAQELVNLLNRAGQEQGNAAVLELQQFVSDKFRPGFLTDVSTILSVQD